MMRKESPEFHLGRGLTRKLPRLNPKENLFSILDDKLYVDVEQITMEQLRRL